MSQKYYKDNRDIRNAYYKGDLVVECEANDVRATTYEKAKSEMIAILKMDLKSLKEFLERSVADEKKDMFHPKLTHDPDFRFRRMKSIFCDGEYVGYRTRNPIYPFTHQLKEAISNIENRIK